MLVYFQKDRGKIFQDIQSSVLKKQFQYCLPCKDIPDVSYYVKPKEKLAPAHWTDSMTSINAIKSFIERISPPDLIGENYKMLNVTLSQVFIF